MRLYSLPAIFICELKTESFSPSTSVQTKPTEWVHLKREHDLTFNLSICQFYRSLKWSRNIKNQKKAFCLNNVDKPARLTIRVLWFLFLIVRRVPRPSESGCKKCNGLKKYLLGHTFSWKRLSAILCPWNPPWWWFFSLKLNKKCLKTPSKIKGLSFISSNLGNMDFFLIFNCISH